MEHTVDEVMGFKNDAEKAEDRIQSAWSDLREVSPVELCKRELLAAA
ncbi:MAG: hypothetical protein HC869_22250 [Rhodospirillales bacterium]|nr:hypothetical protein [Rhodospirillales bacterium]